MRNMPPDGVPSQRVNVQNSFTVTFAHGECMPRHAMRCPCEVVALLTSAMLFLRCDATAFHDWDTRPRTVALGSGVGPVWRGQEASTTVVGTSGREMHLLPGLVSHDELVSLHAAASCCDSFDSDEPDTVDKAATFQVNVLEDGKPTPAAAELAALLTPIIKERLLPYVRAKFGCPNACTGDALLRRYRQEERVALNLHYDVQAFATAIIPLSVQKAADTKPFPSLSSYVGGLFVQGGASLASRRLVRFTAPGDVLVHQFDLMHGVQVESGTRLAIAVWFYDSPRSRHFGVAPWVLRAADAGNPDAQFLQATFCAQGRFGNARDDDAAERWLRAGAEQGHAISQLGLARHVLGRGDEAAAAAHFRLAAEQGHVEAQYALALCFHEGMGLRRSVPDAERWFAEAAAQGGEVGKAAALELEEIDRGDVNK